MQDAGMQLREANAQPSTTGALTETQPHTVDAALARAHAHLIKGELQEAAHVLELSTSGSRLHQLIYSHPNHSNIAFLLLQLQIESFCRVIEREAIWQTLLHVLQPYSRFHFALLAACQEG